jgi:DNA modification methylase
MATPQRVVFPHWTNPGDVVLSPFAGIGSEGVVALRHQRKFLGVELKDSYYTTATRFLEHTAREGVQANLFDAEATA